MSPSTIDDIPNLTIIIPTYNRADQLRETLESIHFALFQNNACLVHTILIDNNSNPHNREQYLKLVREFSESISVEYVLEGKQGRSNACNTGAANCSSKWIAFIDDDETLAEDWISTALRLIQLDDFSYFGGHVLPNWEIPPPRWLPIHKGQFRGVLGWIELSDVEKSYDDFDASLCGGNMIVNREKYLAVGGFSPSLGRGSSNLLGGEDGEFHRRLKRAGAKGLYCPQLTVRHWIPASRMTIKYHLRWAYWSGASNRIRVITQPQTAEKFPHLLGVPRYRFSKGLQGLCQFLYQTIMGRLKKQPDGAIGLLNFMYLAGLLRGRVEGKKLGFDMNFPESSR